jgi:hypothetical protein
MSEMMSARVSNILSQLSEVCNECPEGWQSVKDDSYISHPDSTHIDTVPHRTEEMANDIPICWEKLFGEAQGNLVISENTGEDIQSLILNL